MIKVKDSKKKIDKLKKKNVVIHGRVPDQIEFLNSMDIMLVPLLSGSGIRVKIIEGLAMGKCIISTSIGAEGILYTDNENINIADSPTEFANKIKELVRNGAKKSEIEKNAIQLANTKYNLKNIITSLTDFYDRIGK